MHHFFSSCCCCWKKSVFFWASELDPSEWMNEWNDNVSETLFMQQQKHNQMKNRPRWHVYSSKNNIYNNARLSCSARDWKSGIERYISYQSALSSACRNLVQLFRTCDTVLRMARNAPGTRPVFRFPLASFVRSNPKNVRNGHVTPSKHKVRIVSRKSTLNVKPTRARPAARN